MKTAVQVLLSERVIAFNPLLADIAGDVKGGLFLSQCCFMSTNISKDSDGWFYATDSQWHESTRLSRKEIIRIRKELIDLGVISYRVRGQAHKTYYRVDWQKLEKLILDQVGFSSNNAQNDERDVCESQQVKNCTEVPKGHTKRESKKELRENLKENNLFLNPLS